MSVADAGRAAVKTLSDDPREVWGDDDHRHQ
jgi:hypothetical protein